MDNKNLVAQLEALPALLTRLSEALLRPPQSLEDVARLEERWGSAMALSGELDTELRLIWERICRERRRLTPQPLDPEIAAASTEGLPPEDELLRMSARVPADPRASEGRIFAPASGKAEGSDPDAPRPMEP